MHPVRTEVRVDGRRPAAGHAPATRVLRDDATRDGSLRGGTVSEVASIARARLHALATLAGARLDGPGERDRLSLLDETHEAGRRLTQLLAAFTRHTVAECRGSHSAWDVQADADAVFEALDAYAHALDHAARAFPVGRIEPRMDR